VGSTTVEAVVGETFEVELEGVPTSGFLWEAASFPDDLVRLVGEDVDAEPRPIGGAAVQRFRFEALAPGEGELRLAYRRPWESKPAAEERTVKVTITER
jgi:inhibitor of cysteine peptidase